MNIQKDTEKKEIENEHNSLSSKPNTSTQASKKSMYDVIVLWVITCSILILPLFVIPFLQINFFYAKFGLMTFAVLVASIVLTLQVLNDREVEKYSLWSYGIIFALPVAYGIASLFSSPIGLSLIGSGADTDTAYFLFLGSLLMYLISRVFRLKNTIFVYILGFIGISSLISVFHLLRFVFGADFLSLGIFNTVTSNTIGGFNEMAIFAGLSLLVTVLTLELLVIQKNIRIALYFALVVSLITLCITNFNLQQNIFGSGIGISVSAVVALFSLVLFIHKKVAQPKEKLPLISLSVLFITLICSIALQPISNFVLPKIGVTQNDVLDIRVAPRATASIAFETYKEGVKEAIVGVGPNKFLRAWGKHKPVGTQNSVNATPFWGIDFNAASGFIPTAFVTAGILGLLAWFFFLASILYHITQLLKKVARPDRDPVSVYVAWVVSVGTIFLWSMSLLFTTGPTITFLAFVFTGLLLATLVREELIQTKIVRWDISTYWKGFFVTFAMIIFIFVLISIGYVWQQRAYAAIQMQKATQLIRLDATKVSEAEILALKAVNTYFNTEDLRITSEIALIRPMKLIGESQGVVSPDKLNQEIVNDISLSINAARRASIERGLSLDYRDWLQLGRAYETATFLGATSTATLAVESYAQAERLNPTNPIPPYLIARLYSLARGFDVAEVKLKRAIELKSDYADAIALLNSIQEITKSGQRQSLGGASMNIATSTANGIQNSTQSTSTSTSTPKR